MDRLGSNSRNTGSVSTARPKERARSASIGRSEAAAFARSNSSLASWPKSSLSQREELRRLILDQAILRQSELQPVVSRDGRSARWMLDSLSVTMQTRGAELAAGCLLKLLERFEGRQLATFGTTGIPLLQSIVLKSEGLYSGLLVRKEVKPHGSMRRIEGQLRMDEPVVLIDDSISSGLSMESACHYLEQAGMRVEGAVVLVRFCWEHGCSRMQAHGYHLESVFDIWEDLMPDIPGEPELIRNPTKDSGDVRWSERRAPNGLHPTKLVRTVLDELLRTGQVLRPPQFVDREYDCRGGAWVSLRDKDEIYLRYARSGFWQFPWEEHWSCPESLVRAAWLAWLEIGSDDLARSAVLERSVLAVTFFDKLEECQPGDLDNDKYGIVVCSKERAGIMGGALPRMPGIGGEWDHFCHAAYKNAGLSRHEPYQIYRHNVLKIVEPGVTWQPSGVPASPGTSPCYDPAFGAEIARRARSLASSEVFGTKAGRECNRCLPIGLESVFVTVYFDGKVKGCAGSQIESLDHDLQNLVAAAIVDERFTSVAPPTDPDSIAVTVSLLFNRLVLGELTAEEVSTRFRLADQALAVRQDQKIGMLLPFVAVRNNWDRAAFVREIIVKAGITEPPFEWVRYDCATWLAGSRGCDLLQDGFPQPSLEVSFAENVREIIEWQSGYLTRNQRDDGSFYFIYDPIHNYRYQGGGLPRSAHAAWTLRRAARLLGRQDLSSAADKGLAFHLNLVREEGGKVWLHSEDEAPSVAELAFTLLAVLEQGPGGPHREIAALIAQTLWSLIDQHGRIRTHFFDENISDEYQDYFPGQTLLALAVAALHGVVPADQGKLLRALRFYRHRYHYKRDFGQVSWLMQAGRGWWEVERDKAWSDLVFEIADWVLQFQLRSEKGAAGDTAAVLRDRRPIGGFITPQQNDGPGYTTALYLEGLSAAAHLARQMNDQRRYRIYCDSCREGFRFLRTLVFRPEHGAILPNAAYAVGGLRASALSSEVRTDFVQHSLAAAIEVANNLEWQNKSNKIQKYGEQK